jgi:cell division protein FtsB
MRRVIIGFYLVLFLGLGLTSGVFFWQTRAEYSRLRQLEEQSQRRLAEAEIRLREQEKILDRLRNDREYVEKVIRLQLHYARPDEFIFRFEN